MILFMLRCADGHEFEAWFRNNAAFDRQHARGEIACPVCGVAAVEKAPMAPRLARAHREASPPSPAEMRRALQELRNQVETNCDYVGDKFAEEARKIHYGESDKRGIYGETTDEEAEALADEGIEFGRLPWIPRGN